MLLIWSVSLWTFCLLDKSFLTHRPCLAWQPNLLDLDVYVPHLHPCFHNVRQNVHILYYSSCILFASWAETSIKMRNNIYLHLLPYKNVCNVVACPSLLMCKDSLIASKNKQTNRIFLVSREGYKVPLLAFFSPSPISIKGYIHWIQTKVGKRRWQIFLSWGYDAWDVGSPWRRGKNMSPSCFSSQQGLDNIKGRWGGEETK